MTEQIKRDAAFYQTTGFNAYRLGCTSFDCPYKFKTMEARNWLIGYVNAKQSKPKMFEVNPIIIRRPASGALKSNANQS
jgi:hypothetical protein